MNRGLKSHGYTIIEVMIVLAITSALLIMVMLSIAGQQRKTEFSQSVNDIQAQINDVINTVSTGYAVNTGDFTCTNQTNSLVLGSGSNNQGSNQDCIVLGRAFQFAVGGNASNYNIYTIVGLRQIGGQDVDKLSDAKPTVLSASNGGKDSFEGGQIQYGLQVTKMYYRVNSSDTTGPRIGAVAFVNSLASYGGCTNLCSGATNVELRPVQNSALNSSADSVTTVSASSGINYTNLNLVPAGGVVVCLQSAGTSQYGVITIGGNGRQLTTKLDILDSNAATASGGVCDPNS